MCHFGSRGYGNRPSTVRVHRETVLNSRVMIRCGERRRTAFRSGSRHELQTPGIHRARRRTRWDRTTADDSRAGEAPERSRRPPQRSTRHPRVGILAAGTASLAMDGRLDHSIGSAENRDSDCARESAPQHASKPNIADTGREAPHRPLPLRLLHPAFTRARLVDRALTLGETGVGAPWASHQTLARAALRAPRIPHIHLQVTVHPAMPFATCSRPPVSCGRQRPHPLQDRAG